jgi:putative ABC transport system substrate-binding protein
LRSYAVGANVDVAELNAQLKRGDVKVVIALGNQGFSAASGLARDIAVVAGGVLAFPTAQNRSPYYGISMAPDPSLLFARLRSLQPGVKRVLVIYDPLQNGWLIKLAREAAKAQGLDLVAQEARTLAAAAKLYEAVLSSADPHKDAIWLPQDSVTVDENAILPLVLKASWERNVTVFSSRISDVRRGALFALYPNHREMGRNLATSALGLLAGETRAGLVPLRGVGTAFNIRTASHIGLNLSSRQQQMFDSIFPER